MTLPWAKTWADMRPGHTDRERREHIREIASSDLKPPSEYIAHWGFRIRVFKAGSSRFDIENVPKVILDAFCRGQIVRDQSRFASVGLYDDDTIDHVRILEVIGERVTTSDQTIVEIYGRRGAA